MERKILSVFLFGKNRQSKKKNNIKLKINDNLVEISEHITVFYKKLYKTNFTFDDTTFFFDSIKGKIPEINRNFKDFCDGEITLNKLNKAVTLMADGKSPGPDGITVELYR